MHVYVFKINAFGRVGQGRMQIYCTIGSKFGANQHPPSDWDLKRRQGYFDWAKAVIDRLRGAHGPMETIFDEVYAKRP